MKKSIITALLVVTAAPLFAANWVHVGGESRSDETSFLDIETIEYAGAKVRYWILRNVAETATLPEGSALSSKHRWELDCEGRYASTLYNVRFAQRDGADPVLGPGERKERSPITPDSIEAHAELMFCQYGFTEDILKMLKESALARHEAITGVKIPRTNDPIPQYIK